MRPAYLLTAFVAALTLAIGATARAQDVSAGSLPVHSSVASTDNIVVNVPGQQGVVVSPASSLLSYIQANITTSGAAIYGAPTAGHCVTWHSATQISDAGAACGSGGGGVTSVTAGTGLTGGVITTTGTIALATPSFTTLGGVEALAPTSHTFLTGISTAGAPSAARPACADLSDAAASCNTDATNASNITSGTLAGARLAAGAAAANLGFSPPAVTGTPTAGDCVSWVSATQITDAGGHCNIDTTPTTFRYIGYYSFPSGASSDGYSSLTYIEFHATVGGSQIATGGTAYATATFPSSLFAPAYAFIPNSAKTGSETGWAFGGMAILYYDLGVGQASAVAEVAITARLDSTYFSQAPNIFIFAGSNDGKRWYFSRPQIATTAWTPGSTQTFAVVF